jgi:quinoprotein glucose dehydrogenase
VQGIDESKLIDFTPALRAEATRLIRNYRIGPLFTPPSLYQRDGTWGTLTAPNLTGGTNWPGGAYDPETHIVYVHSKTQADVMMTVRNEDRAASDFDYVNMRSEPPVDGRSPTVRDSFRPGVLSVQGLPLLKPPYGRITAIDLTRGDIAWQVAHGDTPDDIRNHPALKGLKLPRTGRAGVVGPLATKTLVICGEAGFYTNEYGVRGAMLRAYDKATGEEKGAVYMSAPQSGSPMTYRLANKQYIVVAIGGGNYSAELVAYRLPGVA